MFAKIPECRVEISDRQNLLEFKIAEETHQGPAFEGPIIRDRQVIQFNRCR